MKNPPLPESLGICLRGVRPLKRIAMQIMVSLEARHMKKTLGYVGNGEWHAYRDEIRPTWEDLIKAQADFTEPTERNLYLCTEAVRMRLAASSRNEEAKRIWKLMETPPSELTPTQRQELVNGIMKHALKEQDTRASLMKEAMPPLLKLKTLPTPDQEAVKRGAEQPESGVEPANRFRDLVAFIMARGKVDQKRAHQVAMLMMPDEMLTPSELAWKRLRKQCAEIFCESDSMEDPEA